MPTLDLLIDKKIIFKNIFVDNKYLINREESIVDLFIFIHTIFRTVLTKSITHFYLLSKYCLSSSVFHNSLSLYILKVSVRIKFLHLHIFNSVHFCVNMIGKGMNLFLLSPTRGEKK